MFIKRTCIWTGIRLREELDVDVVKGDSSAHVHCYNRRVAATISSPHANEIDEYRDVDERNRMGDED